MPQGLVVRFGLGLDALCKIKSNQIKIPTLHCTVNSELLGRFFRRLHTFSFAILSKYAIRRLV